MEKTMRKLLIAALLVLLAVVSALVIADWAMSPNTHTRDIASIDEKTATVLRLTAATTLSSAGISAIPGDAATPIAEKLADFTEYFLLILCVLYAEKFLISILGGGFFRILLPIALALCAGSLFWKPQLLRRLAGKLALIGLALYLVIPFSLRVSDAIYNAYQSTLDSTISAAEELNGETSQLAEAGEDKGLLASVLDRISETAESLGRKAANILNRFIEALAVMIVTSCVIPILVLLFFLWVIKQLTGLDLQQNLFRRKGEPGPAAHS